MALWIGIATFLLGGGLWYRSQMKPESVPRWMPRLALGAAALGVGTMSLTQPGLAWTLSSIGFSLVAIVLITLVIIETRRR